MKRRHGALRARIAVIAVPVLVGGMAALVPLTPTYAASGDFSLNLAAAAPFSYNHLVGGGAFDDGTHGTHADIVESLEGGDFACGDIATFLTQVTVDNTTQALADGPQTIDLDYRFLMDTTGASGAAVGDITQVRVNYAPVTDLITGEDTVDQGISDDHGSTATLTSETQSGPMFHAGSTLNGTVRVTDLERNEKVIVRVDTRILCQPGGHPTGNLQAALTGARLTAIKDNVPVSPPSTINAGNQTVPFKQIGSLHFPELQIQKTVTAANKPCPGTESIDIRAGDTVKYCYRVTNPSGTSNPPGAALYDVTAVKDDNLTPSDPTDDFWVSLTGLSDVDGDGHLDDLAPGGQAAGEKPVQIIASRTGSYTNTADVEGYSFPGDTTIPFAASDTASVKVTSVPEAAIATSKSVADADGDGAAELDEVLTYTISVTNIGVIELTDVRIADPKLGRADVPCGAGPLAPGATRACQFTPALTYTVNQDDIRAGHVDNLATASAQPPTGRRVTDDDTATIDTLAQANAGLSIKKQVDRATALPGSLVTYTLTVHNDQGSGPADDVVVTDALPAGTTFASATSPCSNDGGTVTCALGAIEGGATVVLTIVVRVDQLNDGAPDHEHQLDVTKVETQLSLQPGETSSAIATCPAGYFATDGSVRLDAVDQGTGSFADEIVLESHATAGGDGWSGTVRNTATGSAQAKVNVVCASTTTTSIDGHSHALILTPFQTASLSFPDGGTQMTELTCAAGHTPVSPGFAFTSGRGQVNTVHTATGWEFIITTPGAAQATVSLRCLSNQTAGPAPVHQLAFTEIAGTVSASPGVVTERQLICPVDYKGIVASERMDPGLVSMGNDPQPITRVFRFFNPTGGTLTADYGLLCMRIRTGGTPPGGGPITNTATVRTSTSDVTTDDDSDSVTFDVVSVLVAGAATVVGPAGNTAVRVHVSPVAKRRVTMKLVSTKRIPGTSIGRGDVLARTATRLRAEGQAVSLAARPYAARPLRDGRVKEAKLVITARNGTRTVAIVRIRS